MFIRGSGIGKESKRLDRDFYRGIVVKNDDPLSLNRVKVYIPELSNQPYDEWFDKFDALNIKFPGTNNKEDNWADVKIFEEMANKIPWASPCFPIFGEGVNSRYYTKDEIATTSDCNYTEGFEVNNEESITLKKGSYSPGFLYENENTRLGDAFSSPKDNFSVKCNPYSFGYAPNTYTNKTKGIIGVPNVGTKVWVFHELGSYLHPVYFGVIHDQRELSVLNNTDNASFISPSYSGDFENRK